jgi:hypothetical protein
LDGRLAGLHLAHDELKKFLTRELMVALNRCQDCGEGANPERVMQRYGKVVRGGLFSGQPYVTAGLAGNRVT